MRLTKLEEIVGYKIKLYPTKEIEEIFKQYFGASRFVYNLGIHLQEENRKEYLEGKSKYSLLSYFSLERKFSKLKKKEEYSWLNNFDNKSIALILKDVSNVYERFLDGLCNHPKYHKKKFSHQMFAVRSDRLSIMEDTVRLPSIGIVSCDRHNHPEIIGNGNKDKKSETYRHYYDSRVIFDGCNYWLTFILEESHEENIEANSCKRFKNNEVWQHKDYSEPIGIDLGCKKNNWIVDSRGNRINRPDTSKEEKQIKKYQRKLAIKQRVNELMGKKANSTVTNEVKRRKRQYTKNEEKILKKLNKAYKRITNKKEAVIHEYTCSIIQEKPRSIVMENLKVNNMMISKSEYICYKHRKNHNKLVKDSMLYTIRTIIEQKAKSNNIPFILADKEYPSSQLCSKCGYRQKIGINRTYKCPVCGNEIDRDENAALNLSHLGYPEYNQYNYTIA